MAKLIITIMSIGIAGLASLMASDYISTLYLQGVARANAQAWVTEAAEITSAARQSGSLSLTSDNWAQGASTGLTAAALVPTYLSDLPKNNNLYAFWPCYITGGTTSCPRYVTDSTHTTDATLLEATVQNLQVCQEIERLANRDNITLSTSTVTGSNPIVLSYIIPTNANQQFACVNASGTYYFLYRVYLDR